MLLYRITKTKFAEDLSGDGARIAGGRWNLPGTPVIYTASSVALATLEAFVHTSINMIPRNLSLATLDFPYNLTVKELPARSLPVNWQKYPPPIELAKIGSKWVEECDTVAMSVPSSIINEGDEKIYILNPRHKDFKKIKISKISDYVFNDRLFER